MENAPTIHTATMAKVLEDQGNYSEALRIYRHLIADNPNQPELAEALTRVKMRIGKRFENQMVLLFEEWVELLCTQNRVDRLRRLDTHLDPSKR